MKKRVFSILFAAFAAWSSLAQTTPPTQHIYYSSHYGYRSPIQIIDSIYAGDYYSSMVSLSYTILYNGVPIDSMHKFGTVTLTMRSQANNFQVNNFVTGSLNLPQDVSLMGMNASSFSLGIINTTVACNRNRPIILDMKMKKLGQYSVILEIINQNGTTKQNIGTACCSFSPDYYATDGTKGSVWISDTISFNLHTDTVYTYLHIDSACSYVWRDSLYQTSGIYSWNYKDSIGNDSIVYLYLDAGNYVLRSKETVHICDGSSYVFKNKVITTPGSYYDTLQSQYDCDSIHQLELVVHPNYLLGDTLHTCAGKQLVWHGKSIGAAGIYYDSLKSIYGCDSIRFALLQVHPHYFDSSEVYICEGSTYQWHGKNLNAEGIYFDSLKSIYNCDSVFRLTLLHYPRFLHRDTVQVCDKESYYWRGRQLSVEGLYEDSLQTVYGCDSVIQLYLKVHPVYLIKDSGYICAHQQYVWRNRVLQQEGVYYDSLKSRYGCDSVIQLYLKVHPVYLIADSGYICAHQQYVWRNRVLQQEGVYYDSLKSLYGCDSVYRFSLKVRPVFFSSDTQTICSNETVLWRGKRLAQAGTYYDSLKSIYGCDSVFSIVLNTNPAYLEREQFAICDNETYYWHQKSITRAGIYYDSLKTTSGCDSVIQLSLVVNPTYYIEDTTAICAGTSFKWHGRLFEEEGLYLDSLLSGYGCDSVCALFLQVYPKQETVFKDTVCEGTAYNRYGFEIGEEQLTGIDSFYAADSLLTTRGCDSVVALYLTLRNLPKTLGEIHGDTLIERTGTFWYETDSVEGVNSYVWSVSNSSWYWFDDGCQLAVSVTQADTATIAVKGLHDCGETKESRLFVRITVTVPETAAEVGLKAFPNPATDEVIVEWPSVIEGEKINWELCSADGKRLRSGFSFENVLVIPLDGYPKGIYLLRISNGSGCVYTLKINKI